MSYVFHWVLCQPVLPWEAGEGVKLLDKVRGRPPVLTAMTLVAKAQR